MLSFNQRVLALLVHGIVIIGVLHFLGVAYLAYHPIVLGAIFLSYYDLWIK